MSTVNIGRRLHYPPPPQEDVDGANPARALRRSHSVRHLGSGRKRTRRPRSLTVTLWVVAAAMAVAIAVQAIIR
jgi:hypothetical protein